MNDEWKMNKNTSTISWDNTILKVKLNKPILKFQNKREITGYSSFRKYLIISVPSDMQPP